MRKSLALLSTFLAAACAVASASAQSGSPIRILVGVTPGGSTDIVARILAEKLRVSLGEAVVVENKPGAAQRASMAELLKSPADGRTLLYGSSALYCIIPHIYGAETGFDPFKDVTPLSRVSSVPVGIGAGLHIKAGTIAEFLAWAKANPSAVSYASPGAGTSSHFTGILLSQALGVPMTHVPYRGTAPAIADLIGGHIPLVFSAASDFTELARDGKLKLLATSGLKRSPATPDTPTLKEQGVDIAFDIGFDAYAKAGTPPAIAQRLAAALVAAGRDPEVRAKLAQMGNDPVGGTAEELLKSQTEEFRLWEAPVKASGYKGE